MEPEKWNLGKGDSYWKPSFAGSMLNFGGAIAFELEKGVIPTEVHPVFLGGNFSLSSCHETFAIPKLLAEN